MRADTNADTDTDTTYRTVPPYHGPRPTAPTIRPPEGGGRRPPHPHPHPRVVYFCFSLPLPTTLQIYPYPHFITINGSYAAPVVPLYVHYLIPTSAFLLFVLVLWLPYLHHYISRTPSIPSIPSYSTLSHPTLPYIVNRVSTYIYPSIHDSASTPKLYIPRFLRVYTTYCYNCIYLLNVRVV